jgi:hypothetical protein
VWVGVNDRMGRVVTHFDMTPQGWGRISEPSADATE